jgi:adenosyl cobinamide kinase/adenosyl cobinamide phosphate guanylyltransferase
MGKIILIVGGARSGKSTYALELAKSFKKVAFVATCQGLDREMIERIRRHQSSRPKQWTTFEEPKELATLLKNRKDTFDCILIDCLTLFVSNLLLDGYIEKQILEKGRELLAVLKKKNSTAILVSNEVGLGIVPDNKLGRDFRDIAGTLNQEAAKNADTVFFTVSGIPVKIKGE